MSGRREQIFLGDERDPPNQSPSYSMSAIPSIASEYNQELPQLKVMSRQRFETVPARIPDPKAETVVHRFQKIIEQKYNRKFDDYLGFRTWSAENPDDFWAELWEFSGIIYSKKYDQVIDRSIPMEESPKWFEGARLNYAENILKFRDDHLAIVATGETGAVEKITYKQLHREASLYAAAFKKSGLLKGDRVACYMSNRKEAVIAMIAVTSMGAIWTGALPLLGPQAYLSRVKQVDPKFLITVDKFPHHKETIHLLKNIAEIANGLPSLEKVIIVESDASLSQEDLSGIPKSCLLRDFLHQGYEKDGSIPEMVFEQLSFSHPVFINYTSGTTGLPKTLIHGVGGLLPGFRDIRLHWNSRREENIISISPVGWVSWNIANTVLFMGETITLFEGYPYFLSPTSLWDLVDEVKLTRIFLTPTVMSEMERRGYLPTPKHHLSSLNMIIGVGSVVKPHNFDFALQRVKKDLNFAVGYGCTETMGFVVVTEASLPVYRGEISSLSLGVVVEVVDESGQPVVGEMGEVLITAPIPSLPLGIWGDKDGKILKDSYFSKHEGKFCIGDTAIVNPFTKGVIVCGRSDETLKPGGCRFGSSEIYNVVEMFPEIGDSLCVSQYNKARDERAVLFVKMKGKQKLAQDLVERIRKQITNELSVRHVPAVILEAPDIPRNVNGKKMEIVVKKIINGMPYSAQTVTNADCLDFYRSVSKRYTF